MSVQSTILVNRAAHVLQLTLNRPARLNSFNQEMHGELSTALDKAQHDRHIRAVLITGAGRAFCAGQDLSDRDPRTAKTKPDLGATLEKFYNPLIPKIRDLEKPVVCAVNGVAAGAGANLALACDLVLAARSSKFIQSFAKIGLVPDCGGTWTLPHLIGEARAKALALTGEPLDAVTAASWGLIWRVVDDDALMQEAANVAADLAAGPTIGLAATKKAIQAAAKNSLDAQLELEKELQRSLGQTQDYAEGVAAFLEKRKPEFKGHD